MGASKLAARLRPAALATAAWDAWQGFWFDEEAGARLRLFRGALGATLFVLYSIRALDLKLYFSESGIMPLSTVPDVLPMDYRNSIFFHFPGDAALYAGTVVLLVSLAALALGIFPRAAAIVALFTNVSFLHRDMAPSYGVDMISTFFLFYLCLADYRVHEVAAKQQRIEKGSVRAMLGSSALRLTQIQLCIIYGFAGLDKVRGPQWWAGEALWGVVSNVQIARWDFSFLAHVPLLLVAGTYSTLAWEVYFPVLIWLRPARKWMLAFGVAMHLGIAIVVNIPFFSAIMLSAYFVFLEESEAQALLRWLGSLASRLRLSPARR
ncbi:MAG: HTTM domain-containing protein [Deltaproteobacteria bacterium]|nr:HTTM domain-containing protein [Deltaproteobacteria bacterium]